VAEFSIHPDTQRANDGYRGTVERLDRHRHQDNWLQNPLVSASLAGYRR
jgi:hypothetical protein